ncbi:ATP-binding protein [Paenibacillus guangzhouensis]|uniref:ATP-binding protein n=1 Tax=Paenibacillus guangzhouensis TaxID=1473112 RepID=UPI0012677774|nr:ATP-binding protein [Paenibacillus guangzhouensis]
MRTVRSWFMIWIMVLGICGGGITVYGADLLAAVQEEAPTASNGVLNIQHWTHLRDRVLPLNGEWAFYWQSLIEPQQWKDKAVLPEPVWVKVPDSWTNYRLANEKLPNQGYATYRLVVQLPSSEVGRMKSVYVHGVATAYKLWVNGELVLENGVVGPNTKSSVPANYAKMASFQPHESELEFVIQVSSFVQRKAGIWERIEFGDPEVIMSSREASVAYEVFLAGTLLVFGSYHILLYLQRSKNKAPLFFGLTCLAIGLRTLLLGQSLLISFFPQLPWEFAVKLEYLTAYGGVIFFTCYIQNQFKKFLNRWAATLIIGIHVALGLLVMFTPALLFTQTLPYYLFVFIAVTIYWLYLSGMAVGRGVQGSKMHLATILIIVPCVISELLYYKTTFGFADILSLGMFIGLILQGILLAHQFSRSFEQSERLSEELSEWNQTLATKIRRRTLELEQSNAELLQANKSLSQMEQSRRHLLSNISHELGTPMTSIQGYVKAMMDGVVPPGDPKSMKIIFEKTLYLDRLIADLFELSKLEAGQITFDRRETLIVPFVRKVYDKYKFDLDEYDYVFEIQGDHPEQESAAAILDPVRIEQVVSNLLYNAKNNTEPGGKIQILAQIDTNEFTVHVIDTGRGMSEAEIPHLFDRFYRGSANKRSGKKGAGLGLSICKEIVASHEGTIQMCSMLGEGSDVYFTIPLVQVRQRVEVEG